MVSKVIYTTWISPQPYPEKWQFCIDSWKRVMPDYEIRILSLENIKRNPFIDKAIEMGKYAVAGHYARCEALYDTGGIYFDIDVEAVKTFDLEGDIIIGREDDKSINNAVFACIKGHPFMKECMDYMDAYDFNSPTVELDTGPWMFTKLYKGEVLDPEYFYPFHYSETFTPECITPNTRTIHHWAKTWG